MRERPPLHYPLLSPLLAWSLIVAAIVLGFAIASWAADPAIELLETKLQLANTQLQVLQLQFTQIQQEQLRLTAEIEKKKAEAKPDVKPAPPAPPAPEAPK